MINPSSLLALSRFFFTSLGSLALKSNLKVTQLPSINQSLCYLEVYLCSSAAGSPAHQCKCNLEVCLYLRFLEVGILL